ncbi:Phenylalanine--tRNA ligase beta subunit, partial [Frankliniella fusca]
MVFHVSPMLSLQMTDCATLACPQGHISPYSGNIKSLLSSPDKETLNHCSSKLLIGVVCNAGNCYCIYMSVEWNGFCVLHHCTLS